MADITKTIAIIFGAVDNTGGALESISGGIKSLDSGIHSITGPLADLGDTVLKAETAIIALGAAMVSVAVNQAGKFVEGITEIGTLFGGTTQQIADFGQEVLKYGQESTSSFQDITGAIYTAVSAGAAYTNSIELLTTAEELSTAGKADLNATIRTLVSTLNAYGEGTDQAAHYSDVLFTTVRLGQTTLPELSASLSQVTSIASAADVPIETLAAAVAALTAYGVPTAEAMTQIKGALTTIISPTKEATDLAKELGINFNATALQTEGFDGVLRNVTEATGGSIEQMSILFSNVRGLQAALALGVDAGGKFQDSLAQMQSAAGATSDAFKLMQNNFSLINQNIVNNLQATLITAGIPLLDEYGNAGRALAGVFQALTFSISDGAFDPIIKAMEAFGDEATNLLNGIAASLPDALDQIDYTKFLTAFGTLGDSIAGLFQGLDLTDSQDLAKAIQFVIDAAAGLTNVVSGIAQAWSEAIGAADSFIKKMVDTDAQTQISVGFGLGLAQVYEQVRKLLDPLTSGLNGIAKALEWIAGAFIVSNIIKNFELLAGALKLALGFITGPVGIVLAITSLVGGLALFSGNSEAAVKSGQSLADLMKQFPDPVADAAKATEELNAQLDKMIQQSQTTGDEFSRQVEYAAAWDSALEKLNASLAASNQKIDESGNVVSTLQKHTDDSTYSTTKLGETYDETGKKVTSFGDKLTGISTKFKDSGDSAKEATEKSNEYLIKMQELATDERIATIKGTFELNIAALQAQADQAIAIIGLIGTEIDSTGAVLIKLFDLIGSFDSLSWQSVRLIEDQIKLENKIRQQAAEDAHKIAETQIAAYQAQIDTLKSGTPLFNVVADGVEPELRALLFKLLQLIQVEASGSYGNFLLSLG